MVKCILSFRIMMNLNAKYTNFFWQSKLFLIFLIKCKRINVFIDPRWAGYRWITFYYHYFFRKRFIYFIFKPFPPDCVFRAWFYSNRKKLFQWNHQKINYTLIKVSLLILAKKIPLWICTDFCKYSETFQQRTSQMADVPWIAGKKFCLKCDKLFKITSK